MIGLSHFAPTLSGGDLSFKTRMRTACFSVLPRLAGLLFLCFTQVYSQVYAAPAPLSFAGAQNVLYANSSITPWGVGVDKSGNVYFADPATSQVYELRAVGGGALPLIPTIEATGARVVVADTGLDAGGGIFYGQQGSLGISSLGTYYMGDTGAASTTTLGNAFCCVGFKNLPGGTAVAVFLHTYLTSGSDVNFTNILRYSVYSSGQWTELPTPFLADNLALDQWLDTTRQNLIYLYGGSLYYSNFSNGTFSSPSIAVGSGISVSGPAGIAADGNDNVYISDVFGNQLYMVPWSGSPSVNASGGSYGNQVALASGLNSPRAVAADGQGNVYVADTGNRQIVKVQPGKASFGTANVCVGNQTTAPCSQTLTLNYNVSGAVNFGTPAITKRRGVASQDFTVEAGGTCAGAFSGTMCTVNVTFAPVAAGARTATLQMSDSSNNLLISTSLTGTGQGNPLVSIAVTPTNLSLPDGLSQQYMATGTYSDGSTQDVTGSVSWTSSTSLASTTPLVYITPAGDAFPLLSFNIPAPTTISAAQGLITGSTTLTVTIQTISFPAIQNQHLNASPVTISATATSGGPVIFQSLTPGACTTGGNTGSVVTLVAVGTCKIQATTTPGGVTYPAAPVSQSFQVTKEGQTISFGPLAARPLGSTPFTLAASATSGLAVSFRSQSMPVCTVSGTTVTLVAVGTCKIRATQAGNADYAAAAAVDQDFQVTKEGQTI
jgi:hypothetical protein